VLACALLASCARGEEGSSREEHRSGVLAVVDSAAGRARIDALRARFAFEASVAAARLEPDDDGLPLWIVRRRDLLRVRVRRRLRPLRSPRQRRNVQRAPEGCYRYALLQAVHVRRREHDVPDVVHLRRRL